MDKITYNQLPQQIRDAMPAELREHLEREDTIFLAVNLSEIGDITPPMTAVQQRLAGAVCRTLFKMVGELQRVTEAGDGAAVVAHIAHLSAMLGPDSGIVEMIFNEEERHTFALALVAGDGHASCGNLHDIMDALADEVETIAEGL